MRLSKSNILHFSMDFVTISLPKLHRLAYLTFFFKFILFLFPFRQESHAAVLQIALLNILIAFPYLMSPQKQLHQETLVNAIIWQASGVQQEQRAC